MSCYVDVPLLEGSDTGARSVCLLRDEFDDGQGGLLSVTEVTNLLGRELAPLDSWRKIAIEFFRSGYKDEFLEILKEIVKTIETEKDVSGAYRSRRENGVDTFYLEMPEIYNTLSAFDLWELQNSTGSNSTGDSELRQEIKEYSRKVQDMSRFNDSIVNDYLTLIRSMYNMSSGETGEIRLVERELNNLKGKARNASHKKFEFASLVGMGLYHYNMNDNEKALDSFIKALVVNPESDASLRVAISYCLFKLGSYDKARLAAKRALEIDPTSVDSIVMLALVEQIDAIKDKEKANRIQHRSNAADLCSFAISLDPTSSTALINLANHSFCSLKSLSSGEGDDAPRCLDEATIQLTSAVAKGVAVGDELHFGGSAKIHYVTEVIPRGLDLIDLKVRPNLPTGEGHALSVKTKELGKVLQYARQAQECTKIPRVKAESFFIQGRVFHAQGKIRDAQALYKQTVSLWPEMTLAQFALGQISLSNGPAAYGDSLKFFQSVKKISPDDKDTLAYIMLLEGMISGEIKTIDKIKEVANGFPHELDLWLLQGQLRHDKPSEYSSALKCYQYALDIIREKDITTNVLPTLLSNMAVLLHSLGRRLTEALDFIKLALVESERTSDVDNVNPIFKSSHFEGVFYTWSEPFCHVKAGSKSGAFSLSDEVMTNVDLTSYVTAGDEILIGDIIYFVEGVTSNDISARSPVRLNSGGIGDSFEVKKKVFGHNFHDGTLTMCFNYARILEDAGHSKSAGELYVEMCKLHPSFTECYLRLGQIAQKMGKSDEAASWFQRALQVDSESMDALACLGDLQFRKGTTEGHTLAKGFYDKMVRQDVENSRSLVSLGNLYLQVMLESAKRSDKKDETEKNWKASYKYYHGVLRSDEKNFFAANGLGIIMAEKADKPEAFGPAKEVFQKARELNPLNEDVAVNLAHVNQIQSRHSEAESVYLANIKLLSRSTRQVDVGSFASIYEALALSQFKDGHHADALRSLLRGIHQEPSINVMRTWYNVAVVRFALSTSVMASKTGNKTVATVQRVTDELHLARDLFHFLSLQSSKGQGYDSKLAAKNEAECIVSFDLSIYLGAPLFAPHHPPFLFSYPPPPSITTEIRRCVQGPHADCARRPGEEVGRNAEARRRVCGAPQDQGGGETASRGPQKPREGAKQAEG